MQLVRPFWSFVAHNALPSFCESFLQTLYRPSKTNFTGALMATPNLKAMDVEALLALRSQIDARLAEKRQDLEKQLTRLGGGAAGRGSSLKGRKVAPKYADPKSGM